MPTHLRRWFDLPRLLHSYRRRMPLVLVNGLAEQSETWFANKTYLSRQFDVKVPEILVYDGDVASRLDRLGGEVTVDYLADRLAGFSTSSCSGPLITSSARALVRRSS